MLGREPSPLCVATGSLLAPENHRPQEQAVAETLAEDLDRPKNRWWQRGSLQLRE